MNLVKTERGREGERERGGGGGGGGGGKESVILCTGHVFAC